MENLKKIIEHQLNAEDYGNRCESFAKTFFEEINTDDEVLHKKGYHMLKAILDNDMDAFSIAACGWSIKSLLVKAYLMKDTEVIFYDEPIEAEFVSIWDGGYECRTRCKVNLQTFEVYDVEVSKSSEKSFNELEEEYIEIEGLMFKVVPKDEAESIGNDIVFWYGENE